MFRVKMREVLEWVKSHSPPLACGVGIAIGAFTMVHAAAVAGVSWGSFLLGFAAAAATLYWMFREGPAAAPEGGEDRAELQRLACERHRAEAECSRWMARRARLDCRKLRRELREQGWQGGEP